MNGLKPRGRKAWDLFLSCLSSLRAGISFDFAGNPGWNLEMGDIKTPSITLDEIFYYLEKADKPCLVAIDEFQAIAKYPEKILKLYCVPIFSIAQMQDLFMQYNPQIQISAESETKRSIFREKDKTKRSKKESAQHSKSRNKSFVMTSVSAL